VAVQFAPGPPGPQRPDQFSPQFAAALHVQGLEYGFVHQVPLGLAGELDRQCVADLLRAPPLLNLACTKSSNSLWASLPDLGRASAVRALRCAPNGR